MKRNIRNPFSIRSYEMIGSDTSFLKMFSHLALESLAEHARKDLLWDQLYFIRSSPGAGTTSLLRVFQPASLWALCRGQQMHKELYLFMKGMDVISDDDVKLIGVFLPIRDYDSIEDTPIDPFQRIRIFNALLNARLILVLLKSILDFKNLSFPEGLNTIEYSYIDSDQFFKGLTLPCTGLDLYKWAVNIENQIAQAMDSFNQADILGKEGHDELFSFSCCQPIYFRVNKQEITQRFVFMIDDVQSLSKEQRKHIKQYLLTRRLSMSIWLAERLSALSPTENLGSQEDRDYGVINIERYWQKNPKAFTKMLSNIAESRAVLSTDDVDTFGNYLQDQNQYLESSVSEEVYQNELEQLKQLTIHTQKYRDWLIYASSQKGSAYNRALICRQINIYIHRDKSKTQLTLDFESSADELDKKITTSSDVKSASALFLSHQYKLPYYAGFDNLVSLSNYNIQQFLGFSSAIFERVLSQRLATPSNLELNVVNQEKIIRQVVIDQWKELPRIISRKSISFLNEFARYAEKETYRPSAPYAPGVTGFSVTPGKTIFSDEKYWLYDPVYKPIINVLAECVAYNLLVPVEIGQGKKGELHNVYYLNRWLCVFFNLPLGNGGWRHRKPEELVKWIK